MAVWTGVCKVCGDKTTYLRKPGANRVCKKGDCTGKIMVQTVARNQTTKPLVQTSTL